MELGMRVEGWYKDPWKRHENRWFSDGHATDLVRDALTVSHDEPPTETFDGPLVEADEIPVVNETARAGDAAPPDSPNAYETVAGLTPLAWGARTRKVPPPAFEW